ncbi:mitochondrial carrier domain-containing protein [Dipodascopsis tothii]|uniref:mitochondrial carrier domain-containing protein n=1 Tax=Dipodascopsis tothii TaxID=44089 RepID=UPI0034CFDEFC
MASSLLAGTAPDGGDPRGPGRPEPAPTGADDSPAAEIEPSAAKTRKTNQVVGAATAGTRALASQVLTLYLRVPIKLFRPTRVDYMIVPRAINPVFNSKAPWRFRTHSSLALMAHAVRTHGWSFIPNQVLPPLVANSAVGLVLYTTYLTALPAFAPPEPTTVAPAAAPAGGQAPLLAQAQAQTLLTFRQTFAAGVVAGAAQSLAAAPIDAIFTRFSVHELLDRENGGRHKSMWQYCYDKLREVGPRGVFAGYTLSLAKEGLGYGVFFASFETLKQTLLRREAPAAPADDGPRSLSKTIRQKSSAARYPALVLVSGAAAAVMLQAVQFPLGRLQSLHLTILEGIDHAAYRRSARGAVQLYVHAYGELYRQACRLKDVGGARSWPRWLYKGFLRSTVSMLPSTSIGLFVFEIMRIRFLESDAGDAATLLEPL